MEMTQAVKKGLEAGEKTGGSDTLLLMHVGTQQFTTTDETLGERQGSGVLGGAEAP